MKTRLEHEIIRVREHLKNLKKLLKYYEKEEDIYFSRITEVEFDEPEKQEIIELKSKPVNNCKYCKRDYEPTGKNQKYCSVKCKELDRKRQKYPFTLEKTCVTCGGKYKPRSPAQKYCSDKCNPNKKTIEISPVEIERFVEHKKRLLGDNPYSVINAINQGR